MEFSMYQDVALPTGEPATLSWMERLQWDFALTGVATQPRIYEVRIVDPTTLLLLDTLFSFSTGTALVVGDTGWQTHTADLSAFAGQSIRLLFFESIPEAFTGPGPAEFDAISITAVPEPATVLLFATALVGLRHRRRPVAGGPR
jgi:hypothetical protein